jgi:translocation and assembly module TamB
VSAFGIHFCHRYRFSGKLALQASYLIDWSVATRTPLPQVSPMDSEEHLEPPMRRIKKRHIFGAVLLLLLVLLAVVWWQRFTIADRVVQGELDKANVRASYQIEDIGFRTQRLTNVVVGDPANPDLTARLIEINLAIGFGTPQIRSVWVEGARVRGRYADGVLNFGELDKFRDLTSKKPFEFPDLNIAVRDSSLSMITQWGPLGFGIEGQGNLRRSFTGHASLRTRKLSGGGCQSQDLGYSGSIAIQKGQSIINGPISATSVVCPGLNFAATRPELNGEFRLSERFDRWLGDTEFSLSNLRYAAHSFAGVDGTLSFDGGQERTNYALKLDRAAYRGASARVARLKAGSEGDISFGDKGFALSARGSASLAGGAADTAWLSGLSSLASKTDETPVGPVIAQLVPALQGVLKSFGASLNFDAAIGDGRPTTAFVSGLRLVSATGASLQLSAPVEIRKGALRGSVRMAMEGGGLPSGNLVLTPQGAGWAGTLALSPYAAKGGSIDLPKLAFSGGPGGNWQFSGQTTLSGPLLGGRIEGLSLPIDGRWTGGRFSLLQGCTTLRFQSFKTDSFGLPGQSVRACPQGGSMLQAGQGGTRLAFSMPLLSGTAMLGSTPMNYAGSQVRFSLDNGFVASNVAVELGKGDSRSIFNMANIDGRFADNGFSGSFANGAATIGSVPLLGENAQGTWSYIRNILMLDAALTVSDAEQVDRFTTLNVPDLSLSLEDGLITAMAHLHEPKTGIRVADVDVQHVLSTSKGRALLAVDGLTFDDRLQPAMLTPLTVGAIANVFGRIDGDGRIEWDADGVKSTGRFSTRALDFAAAFGPVTGLSTDVAFTDLLGLESAPSQLAQLAEVNPGIPAFGGQIRYQLLPDQKVRIIEGRWPFYGGELILEDTTLDFDVEAQRFLTFRMVGLDAEKFLAGYELENVRVSGVFDGTLPMVFDQEGGRIVGGWLVSRKGGGEVSYLGQLSYEEMGVFANFAFEALRSIRFDEMQIGVEGNIGGEVVTQVRFRGIQQGSRAKRNYITKQLAKLPLEFNVRIEAEFLSLIGSLRALYDAEYAAQRYKSMIDTTPPVTGTEEGQP